MDDVPQRIAELILGLDTLSIDEQRERHIEMIKTLVEMGTLPQIRHLRRENETCALCEWLGEEHRENVLNLIDGHVALREMKLVRRRLPRG